MGCINKLSGMRRILGKQVGLWIAGLAVAGLALFAAQATLLTVPGQVKVTPLTVSAQSSPSLPPEVQALESETAALVFDRDTTTEYTAFDQGHIEVQLADGAEIHLIKIFGPAPYTLTVKALRSGTWDTVDGLSNIKLTNQSTNWNSFEARTPVTTDTLRFELKPDNGGGKKTGAASGLKEIEIWGEGGRHLVAGGAALLAAMQEDKTPAHVSEYPAMPAEAVVSATAQSFSVTLERHPTDLKRAYLAYESFGFNHWVSPARAINGLPLQGGDFRFVDLSWTSQVEPINPAWLKVGQNTVSFSLPAGMTGSYSVRNVRLLTELDDGGNFIASVDSNTDSVLAGQLADADLTTGWAPYDNRTRGKTDKPTLSLHFDKPTQVDGLAFYLMNALDGTLTLEFLEAGKWVSGGATINGRKFTAGWNQLDTPSVGAVDALRLTFENGAGSAAEIRELSAIGSGVGQTYVPRLVVSYPDAGQYFGRQAYLRGYLESLDNGSGTAELFVGGQAVAHSDGAFGVVVSKEDVGLETQSDADPWSVDINAVYPDGKTVTTTVYLDNGGDATQSQGSLPTVAAPGTAQRMNHDGAELDIDPDALDEPAEIKIKSLGTDELPPLDPGMTNVTKGPRKGYRFTPHGQKFKKKIKVKLPYDRKKVPEGLTENDVNTYYFDEDLGRWVRLEREKLDRNKEMVTALTDHFTDMINATLVVPDHPQIASFNPTQIKDIKAADSGAGINLIEPPLANNMGDARLRYPIEVPPGRNGLQPQLAINYNSSGSNGWVGVGWDMPMQAVTIETRWGVPRYDLNLETETYLLNGEQLTPVAHRGELVPRTAEKVFHTRVEGQFRKIIRHGVNPKKYWWEVIDKNGTRYFYGGGPDTSGPTTNSTLVDANGNVNMWSLRIVRDTNDNFIKYRCIRLDDNGLPGGTEPGTSLYLTSITYTGHGSQEGAYKVEFKRDRDLNEPRRPDVIIDARGGFKKVTGDLLRQVEVTLNSDLIRRYEFKYNENAYGDGRSGTAFNKSLLTSITQLGEDSKEFNTHTFTYNDEVRDANSNYVGFDSRRDWKTGNDGVSERFLAFDADVSALGGTYGESSNRDKYVGIGPIPGKKAISVGRKSGSSNSDTNGLIALIDINGDGLPDKVFDCSFARNTDCQGSRYGYRPNTSGPQAEFDNITFGDVVSLPSLPAISREHTDQSFRGTEAYAGGGVYSNNSDSFMTQLAYFTDVNGDGLTDAVLNNATYFNYLNNGLPTFVLDSTLTPLPIDQGQPIDADGTLPNFDDLRDQLILENPLMDAVRRWVAPFSGQITVTGNVQLIDSTATDPQRANYQTADGVRVSVQHNNLEAWSLDIGAADYTAKTPSVPILTVTKGDRIYFRVQSNFDGAYDDVAWNPEIKYVGKPVDQTDANHVNVFRYVAAEDFIYGGRSIPQRLPFKGKIRVAGELVKNAITTDDVTVAAYIFNEAEISAISNYNLIPQIKTPALSRTLTWDQTGNIDVGSGADDISVQEGQYLVVFIQTDSKIDLSQINWAPEFFYTEAFAPADTPTDQDGNPVDTGVPPGSALDVTDADGNFIIQMNPFYDIDLYPVNDLVAPQQAWTVPQTGTITVIPDVVTAPTDSSTDGQLVLTIKRKVGMMSERVTKQIISIVNGTVILPPTFNLMLMVTKDDELYFDYSARDGSLASKLVRRQVRVTYGDPDVDPVIDIPSAFHRADIANVFTEPYRGWGYVGYNGNNSCAQKRALGDTSPCTEPAIDETKLLFSSSVDPAARFVYPAVPKAVEGRWISEDDRWQVKAGSMSASRLGLDDLRLPTSSNYASAPAVPRVSKTRQNTNGGGFYVSIGDSNSNGDALLDFMDLNGDRYPDVVSGQGFVQYTRATGRFRAQKEAVNHSGIRTTAADGLTLGPGGTIPDTPGDAKNSNKNSNLKPPPKQQAQSPSFGFSGSLGKVDNEAPSQLIDVNGDGLPDKVTQVGGNLFVRFNLGYRFANNAELWGTAIISEGSSINASVGASLGLPTGYSDGVRGFSGGVNLGAAVSETNRILTDINGDGLIDAVFNSGGSLMVAINNGNGFATPVRWSDDKDLGDGKNLSFGFGGSIEFSICSPIPPVCIIYNPARNKSRSLSRTENQFMDVNGDGYADYLKSEKDRTLEVQPNQTGRTNLLRSIKRPLGAVIDLEYTRSGNTFDLQQSRWLLTKTTVFDGVKDDTPANVREVGADYQVTKYTYEDGFHDRSEREFYGYKTVTETQLNTTGLVKADLDQAKDYRRVVREFLTNSYYTKGLLAKERAEDVQQATPAPYSETVNDYVLRDVHTRGIANPNSTTATVFPELSKVERKFFEGEQTAGKTTFMTHQYDQYGNVTEYFDDAEPGVPEDNVLATMTYTDSLPVCLGNYIVGKTLTITVKGNGKVMREREGEFNCSNGNMTKHKQKLEGSKGTAETVLNYDPANGNLVFVQGPPNQHGERYELLLGYDDKVQTHVASIRDSFTYESTVNFTVDSLKYGRPESTTDVNGNTISYAYDKFGRTERIIGPYEQGNADAFTFKFSYGHDSPEPWALTQHYDKDANNAPKDPIETILIADGLKRVLQVKKDATIRGVDKMTVSGRVAFDHVGRTVRQYYPSSEVKALNTGFTRVPDTSAVPTIFRYDVLDRNVYTEIPDTTATTIDYDIDRTLKRFRTRAIDAETNNKETYRDVRELITRVIEFNPKGNQPRITTKYVYDALKQITDVVDDKGNLTKVVYDNFGRRTSINNPDSGLIEIRYDLANNVIKKITANLRDQSIIEGRELAIDYDYEFNRVKSISYPNFTGNNVVYEYGAAGLKGKGGNRVGRVIQVTDQSGTEERFYGNLGEVTKEIKTVASETQGNSPNSPEVYATEYFFDTFGRLLTLSLPDGEVLTHTYDSGGSVNKIEGDKRGDHYVYLERMDYDRFEQRVFARFGNGIETEYEYRVDNRRLLHLNAGKPQTQAFQQLAYNYDKVFNITDIVNNAPEGTTNGMGGTTEQHYEYDNLYRLTSANGVYKYAPKRKHEYTLAMRYDSIHNIEHKNQRHWRTNPSGGELEQKGTTYKWDYAYGGKQPHAPTHIGNRSFSYDANGNQEGWTNDNNGQRRNITWDEENRIQAIAENGQTTRFKYDDQGQRVFKIGKQGETAYINQFYTVRNRSVVTKHVFAGITRIASRLVGGNGNTRVPAPGTTTSSGNDNSNTGGNQTNNGNAYGHDKQAGPNGTPFTSGHPGQGLANRSANSQGKNAEKNPHLSGTHPGQGLDNRSATANAQAQNTNKNPHLVNAGGGDTGDTGGSPGGSVWKPEENFLYFYHPDHLGSTGYVTDKDGEIYEHIEYFPFGETWVQEASNTERTPYLYTSKELDQETGLYYYGARYYDPRTSVWISTDPALENRFGNNANKLSNAGVFQSGNLAVYSYGFLNPLVIIDPDGRDNFWIGGAGDKSAFLGAGPTNIMRDVMNRNPDLFQGDNHYYGYEDMATIMEAIKSTPGKHNIIGHSYGGAAAIDITAEVGEDKIGTLITLDPVALLAKSDPKNYDNWINVHQKQTFVDYIASIPIIGNLIAGILSIFDFTGGSGDTIATIGGQLGTESGAINIESTKAHADAGGMLDEASAAMQQNEDDQE